MDSRTSKDKREAVSEGKIQPGDLVVLVAFGLGFTGGSILIRC